MRRSAIRFAAAALAAAALAVPARSAERKSVTRNGRTVEFVECPKCEMRVRFSADGAHATVNSSLLREYASDRHRHQRVRTQLLERAFAVMELAASASEQPFWGGELVKVWRARGLPATIVQREDRAVVLAKDSGEPGGNVREVAFFNMGDSPRDFRVSFTALEIGGKVSVIDLTERAIPQDFSAEIAVRVPEKSAKIYRLSAEKRVERSVFSVAGADVREPARLVWKGVSISNRARRTVELTCDIREDRVFFVSLGSAKPVRVEARAIEGMASIAVAEVLPEKGVHDLVVTAPEGENLPVIKEVRMFR